MRGLQRFLDGLERLLDFSTAIMTVVLLVMLFIQVVNRYVLGISWPMLQFIVPLCFVWVCMLGSAVAVRRRLHFEIDLLKKLFGRRGGHWHGAAVAVSVFLGGFVIAWTGWGFAELGMLKKNPATGYSMIYIYASLFGGGVLICVLALEQTLRHVIAALGDGEARQ